MGLWRSASSLKKRCQPWPSPEWCVVFNSWMVGWRHADFGIWQKLWGVLDWWAFHQAGKFNYLIITIEACSDDMWTQRSKKKSFLLLSMPMDLATKLLSWWTTLRATQLTWKMHYWCLEWMWNLVASRHKCMMVGLSGMGPKSLSWWITLLTTQQTQMLWRALKLFSWSMAYAQIIWDINARNANQILAVANKFSNCSQISHSRNHLCKR